MAQATNIEKHFAALRACQRCPRMIGPVVYGRPVASKVILVGQAPGDKEPKLGRPFAWTAGKTLFKWFHGALGWTEEDVRDRVYFAAVCRCFPGKAEKGGDRVPSPEEIEKCSRHIAAEVKILKPDLVIPVGKLAIAQLYPDLDKLTEIIGEQRRGTVAGHTCDVIALPHPSGASTWHRTEPGKTLLAQALAKIARHPAWKSLVQHRETTLAAATISP
jgi:uracil-DNA glycosylase